MLQKLLIANRGEIACRIMRTARRLGCRCIAIYSDSDKDALHVAMADEAYRLGPSSASESYLRIDKVISIARQAGADAVHPGYGFLSENPEFAEACESLGIVFIGPSAAAIRAMGHKDAAKRLMEKAGVAVVPGYHGERRSSSDFARRAEEIGYPVLIKAIAGGGGRGMRRVDRPALLAAACEAAEREAAGSFGDGRLLMEKFIERARHIEVQVVADRHGNTVHLFERDCSLQRRHQKVIEEAPAPGITPQLRQALGEAAVKAARAVSYQGAGTVEFLVDTSEGLRPDRFYFMEMNTRLQVEHGVTEAITGQDLVEWQLRIAAGEPLPLTQDQIAINGHAFEARLYAEDPDRGFLPQTGRLMHFHLADDDVRIDTGVRQGDEITSHYDPMIAKLITWGMTREVALNKLSRALERSRVLGCTTNIDFLRNLVAHPNVISGNGDTGLIEREMSAPTSRPATDIATAIAAIASLRLLKNSRDGDPWTALLGWRAWGEADYTADLEWHGEAFAVHVKAVGTDRYRIELTTGDLTCTFVSRNGDKCRFDFGDRLVEAVVVESERQIGVFTGGSAHTFTLPRPPDGDDEHVPVSGQLASPITGQVKVVKAMPGSVVTKGTVLVVIEAMKMEHSVIAARDGRVAEVFVRDGDQIAEGTILLNLEIESD